MNPSQPQLPAGPETGPAAVSTADGVSPAAATRTAPDPTTATPDPATAKPDPATGTPGNTKGERILALDVLRGIAILGTLASNIWIFASVAGTPPDGGWGKWFADASHWLPNGKFLGLLTIMFGIGLEIQRQAALRAGRKWPGKYPIRAGLLFLDGLVNFILVVQFDVLRAYALVGLLVAFLLLLNEKVQWWLIGLFVTAHVTLMLTVGMGDTGGKNGEAAGEEEIIKAGPGQVDPSTLSDAGQSSYWDSVMDTLRNFTDYHSPGSEFFIILVMGVASFLLGAKLFRNGVFAPERSRLRWWLIGIGFGVFLPLDYVLSMTSLVPEQVTDLSRYGTSTVVALGILALVAEFYVRRKKVGFTGRRLAEVGRMALSCYLLQNIVGVICQYTLFTSPAFAPYSNTALTYLFLGLVALILLTFAHLWLRKFSRGPFELLWNWSYRKLARE